MKASEHFDLPLEAHQEGLYQSDGTDETVAEFNTPEQAMIAANCINHADSLADALESMLEHEKEMAYSVWDYSEHRAAIFEQSEEFARFNESFADELAALAAYRSAN